MNENVDADVNFTHVVSTPKVKRATSINEKTFISTYFTMAKAGNTNDEIAQKLGMNVNSLVSRASAMRAEWKQNGLTLPYPKTTRGSGTKSNKMSVEDLKTFLESLDGSSTVGQ